MRAAILNGGHDFRIEEKEKPVPGDHECLIEVKACGVCHSEIFQWSETNPTLEYPRFIGHEAAGIVVETGSEIAKFKKGDRVAVWIDGKGYAEYITVQEDRIYPIADGVDFAEAMAEPIGCTTNGVIKANITIGDTVALVGTGFMGLIMLQQLKMAGAARVIAIDLRKEMLDTAKELGADYTLNPAEDDIKKFINELTDGKGVDVSFEIGGNQKTLDTAADICRMEGKLVIFGFHPGERKIKDLGFWNWMAFDIINAHFRDINTILNGTRIGMELLNLNKLDMKKLITHKYPLEKIEDAFNAADEKPEGFIKAVIVFE